MNQNENPNNSINPQVVPNSSTSPVTVIPPGEGTIIQGNVPLQELPISPGEIPVAQGVVSSQQVPVAPVEVPMTQGMASPQEVPVARVEVPIAQGMVSPQEVPVAPIEVPVTQEVVPSQQEPVVPTTNIVEPGTSDVSVNESPSNKKPPSKFKYFLVIVFFVLLFSMVYFLPDISEYLAIWKAQQAENKEVINTGNLVCDLERTTDKFNVHYYSNFAFNEQKITNLIYSVTTKGDITSDAEELQKIKGQCDLLELNTANLEGVIVSCDLSGSEVEQRQEIDYALLDKKTVTAAYVEAGGTYPEFKEGQNIDEIQKIMNASGYSCKKTK